MNILIAGCGYVGRRVARAELDRGSNPVGLVRSRASADLLARAGIAPLIRDLDSTAVTVPSAQGIYYFAPPPPRGCEDTRIGRFLDGLTNKPGRIVLLSTTGVYGNCDGEWIDETRSPAPQVDRARRRRHAELTLQHWCDANGVRAVVLRVPGLYGPGKLPVARLQRREPVLDPAVSPWSNRVHVDDLVGACVAAMHHRDPMPVYNISDGHPSTMSEYFFAVADALDLPRPPVLDRDAAEHELGAGMRSYLAESKRIDNSLMREHLGVVLRFPGLEAGLAASLGETGER